MANQIPEIDHNYHRPKKAVCKWYRQCKVPSCKSSSFSAPDKMFFRVPLGHPARQQWLAAAGVITDAAAYNKPRDLYFCEDHFELEKDVENYMAYKMGFVKRIHIRSGSLPSKFSCQQDNLDMLNVNAIVKMDVLQGKNILAIETFTNKSKEPKSGLIINMGKNLEHNSTFEKDEKKDNNQGFYNEYYKFIKSKIKLNSPQDAMVPTNCDNTIVNLIALCKDHDYCKKVSIIYG